MPLNHPATTPARSTCMPQPWIERLLQVALSILGYDTLPDRAYVRVRLESETKMVGQLRRDVNAARTPDALARAELRRTRERVWALQIVTRELERLAGLPRKQWTRI